MLKVGCAGFLGLCLLAVGISALSNLGLPTRSEIADRLSSVEKARLLESQNLRRNLGDSVWPGWGQVDIPVILYNDAYAFLLGQPGPPPGWYKMPGRQLRGGPWELVPDDRLENQPYFRQPLPEPHRTPGAFTVLVGDRWAASMATKDWMAIALRNRVREDVPTVLRPLVPYRLVSGLLLSSSEIYICGLLHESFHAYQGALSPERLEAAETAVRSCESRYPWARPASQKGWEMELDLLMKALRSSNRSQTAGWARQFLAQRNARRGAGSLDADLLQYERAREWLEGLAKYAELEIWRQAMSSPTYRPLPSVSEDPDFGRYEGFEGRWSQEVAQIGRSTGARDGLFYYSGMAQAVLLDRLLPLWKTRAMAGLWLEDLLREALED